MFVEPHLKLKGVPKGVSSALRVDRRVLFGLKDPIGTQMEILCGPFFLFEGFFWEPFRLVTFDVIWWYTLVSCSSIIMVRRME